jgi:hypothetical protein
MAIYSSTFDDQENKQAPCVPVRRKNRHPLKLVNPAPQATNSKRVTTRNSLLGGSQKPKVSYSSRLDSAPWATFDERSTHKERLNSSFRLKSSLAEDTLGFKKLISEYRSTEKSPSRMLAPPTTPSTVSCNSPEVPFDTPDGTMEHEDSESEESVSDSPIDHQVDTSPGKPSNPPSAPALPLKAASTDAAAFEFPTRGEAPSAPDFSESMDSETVNQIIAGMMPSPISSKNPVRDLGNLSQTFQDKMAECEEESEQEMRQSLEERITACEDAAQVPTVKEEAPAKEESSKPETPRKVGFGLADDVRVFSRTTEELNHMLEELSIASISTDDCSADMEVSLASATGEKDKSSSEAGCFPVFETAGANMGIPEESMVSVDHVKFPSLADRDTSVISYNQEEIKSIVDEFIDSHTEDNSVGAPNESLYKSEVSPYRFIHLDCGGPRADSETEMSKVKGTKDVDSDVVTESIWDEEDTSGMSSTKSTYVEDVKHMISDLSATFARVGSELGLKLGCAGFADCSRNECHRPIPESSMDISWLSPSYGDFDTSISRLDSLPDYEAQPVSRTFSLDMTVIPQVNSMYTQESSMSSRDPKERTQAWSC